LGTPTADGTGKIDLSRIAVSGWSCGGLQALTISTSDPRPKRPSFTIALGCRTHARDRVMAGMELPKSALDQLTVPTIYILGGSTDAAYKNGMDDYSLLATSAGRCGQRGFRLYRDIQQPYRRSAASDRRLAGLSPR
jgi:hypothetical protein